MLMMGMWVGTCLHVHLHKSPPPRGMQDPGMHHNNNNNNVSIMTHKQHIHDGATWRPSFLGRHGAKPRSAECRSMLAHNPLPLPMPSPSCSDALSTIVLRSCVGINRVAHSMTFAAALGAPAWVPSSSAQMSSPS